MNRQLKFGYLDESPVVMDRKEAWQLVAGRWVPLDPHEAFVKARLLTKPEFDDYAGPDAPALPANAFR